MPPCYTKNMHWKEVKGKEGKREKGKEREKGSDTFSEKGKRRGKEGKRGQTPFLYLFCNRSALTVVN